MKLFIQLIENLGFKKNSNLRLPTQDATFFAPEGLEQKRDQPLRLISATSLCLLSRRPLRENCPLIWLFCGENDPACRNPDSCLFSAVNDTKLISSFVSPDCFCFYLNEIPVFFCGIPLVGFLILFAFDQMGSLISFLTFNLVALQTEGLCFRHWGEILYVFVCVCVLFV